MPLQHRHFQSSSVQQSLVTERLCAKLAGLEQQYQEAVSQLSSAADSLSSNEVTKINKEMGRLDPIVSRWQAFQALRSEIGELQTLCDDEDADVRGLAVAELKAQQERIEEVERELLMALLPRDRDDDRDVLLEIRPGPGGEEAVLFGDDIFKMYTLFAAARGWRLEVLQNGSTKVAQVRGGCVFQTLKYENGVHRVQRVPATESKGRVHTSTATVVVMPEPDAVSVVLLEKDLKIETMRASGAGGQHVNTTDSAVRITHLPSGLSVHNSEERSQHKNKDRAMKILTARLYDMERQKASERDRLERRSAIGTGDRSERIRTYNFQENRVTDHRIGLTVNGIPEMLQGLKLPQFISALELHDKMEQMAHIDLTAGT